MGAITLKNLFQRRKQLPPRVCEITHDAAETLFASMFGEKPNSHPVAAGEEFPDMVVGVIAFDGEVEYSVALILPEATAPKLALDFAGMELTMDDPNMLFVVGELVNLIAGDLVARMEASGVRTRMSLPSLSRGGEVLRSLSMGRQAFDSVYDLPQGKIVCRLVGGPVFEYVDWPGQ